MLPSSCFVIFVLLPSTAVAAGFWPSFSVLKSNYPSYVTYQNQEILALAGLGEKVYGLPSSVVRLTYALIQSGRDIDISEGECNWSGRIGYSNGRKKYITYADTMRCWLEKNRGQPTVMSTNKLNFQGKKGIIVFENCPSYGKNRTGHVDLWDGSDCLGGCFDCADIRLFSLP